jgi:hypothetical protein
MTSDMTSSPVYFKEIYKKNTKALIFALFEITHVFLIPGCAAKNIIIDENKNKKKIPAKNNFLIVGEWKNFYIIKENMFL